MENLDNGGGCAGDDERGKYATPEREDGLSRVGRESKCPIERELRNKMGAVFRNWNGN